MSTPDTLERFPDPRHDEADRQLVWIALAYLATLKGDAEDCERIALEGGCSPRLFATLVSSFSIAASVARRTS